MTTRKRALGDRGKVIWLQGTIPNVSQTAGTGINGVGDIAIRVPETGVVTEVYTCLGGAITGGDAVLTLTNNGSTWGGGTITITNGSSAAGDVDSQTDLSEDVSAGDYITVNSDGGSTNDVSVHVTMKLVVRDGAYK